MRKSPERLVFKALVGVAQLVRAPDCGSGGRGFESHYPPQKNAFWYIPKRVFFKGGIRDVPLAGIVPPLRAE